MVTRLPPRPEAEAEGLSTTIMLQELFIPNLPVTNFSTQGNGLNLLYNEIDWIFKLSRFQISFLWQFPVKNAEREKDEQWFNCFANFVRTSSKQLSISPRWCWSHVISPRMRMTQTLTGEARRCPRYVRWEVKSWAAKVPWLGHLILPLALALMSLSGRCRYICLACNYPHLSNNDL